MGGGGGMMIRWGSERSSEDDVDDVVVGFFLLDVCCKDEGFLLFAAAGVAVLETKNLRNGIIEFRNGRMEIIVGLLSFYCLFFLVVRLSLYYIVFFSPFRRIYCKRKKERER